MLDYRTKRPQRKRQTRRRRTGLSRRRYETSTHATTWQVSGRRNGISLSALLGQGHKRRNRRSKARLGHAAYQAPGPAAVSPARPAVRISLRSVVNVMALGLLGWALIWFFVSDRFYVNQIVVHGNERVSTDTIVSASGVMGYSIFWVDARQVAENIAGTLPPIKHVRVRYGLPNVISLTVEEQGDEVMWWVAGARYWVDEEGKLHPAHEGGAPLLLVRDLRPGTPGSVDASALIAARQLARQLPELEVVDYDPGSGLRFVHARGWTVYLGTGHDIAQKLSVLRAVEQQLSPDDPAQPTLVDLRFPDTPFIRYPGEGSGA